MSLSGRGRGADLRYRCEGIHGRCWSRSYLKNCINDDVHLAHTFAEISQLVSSEVAAALDPSRGYGVWYYGTERHVYSQRRETSPDGSLRYKKVKKSVPIPRDE